MSTPAKEWLLAQAGVEPSTGARPLRRTIQRHVQDAISEILIAGAERADRVVIEVDLEDGELHFDGARRSSTPALTAGRQPAPEN